MKHIECPYCGALICQKNAQLNCDDDESIKNLQEQIKCLEQRLDNFKEAITNVILRFDGTWDRLLRLKDDLET